MDALDLTAQPPRSPRERLGDLELLMMARTVDKLRATLPGGKLGSYRIFGFSSRMLEKLGISEDDLRNAVAAARSDADVAAWIRRHSDPSQYAAINAELEARTIRERLDDPEFAERYPIVRTLPPDMPRLDMLVADDEEMFAERKKNS